jgi:hypothetical protein
MTSTNGFLIPYLATFSIAGSLDGGFKIVPLDSEVSRYTYWLPHTPRHALFPVTHFFIQNIRGIQFDHQVLMFPKYPLTPYFIFHLLQPCM